MRHLPVIIALTLALPAIAGMYDQPYGIIERAPASQVRKEAPVAITRIDGESLRSTRRSDPLPPGKHAVDVSYASARKVIADNIKTIAIDVQPCVRYLVAAKYTSTVSPEWEPVVAYTETIGECKRKFLKGTAAK